MRTLSKMVWGVAASALLIAGCGDDDSSGNPDATPSPDAPPSTTPDATPGAPDAAPDATPPPPYTPPAPYSPPIAPGGPDQFQAATAAPNGLFYVAGFAAETPTGPKRVFVAKLGPQGPASDFGPKGANGVAYTNIVYGGGNGELDIAVDPTTGKIVVAATVTDADDASDRDVAVTRLETTGAVDDDFGTAGVALLEWSTRILPTPPQGTDNPRDSARAVVVDAQSRVYVLGAMRRNSVDAPDGDFVIARLTDSGDPDAEFGTAGKYQLDVKGGTLQRPRSLGATPHALVLLSDGSLLAGGYVGGNTPFITGAQPVLFKVDAGGEPVDAFNQDSVFYDAVLPQQTEVYGMALHGDHVVTGGYGRPAMEGTNDWVSLRFDVTTGARDLAWGGAAGGAVMVYPNAADGDNCRGVVGLPGGKTIMFGSSGSMAPLREAAFAVLAADGTLDPAFGAKANVLPLGAGEGADDAFWGGAVSGNHALLVGFSARAMQTAESNDNAYLLFLPLE
jgi:uncharacterized delta-60 repeat protein